MNKEKSRRVTDPATGVTHIDCSPAAATVEYVNERIAAEGIRPNGNGIAWYQTTPNGEETDLLVAYSIGNDGDSYILRYTDMADGVLVAYVDDFGRATKDAILYTKESVIAHVLGNSKIGLQKSTLPHNKA